MGPYIETVPPYHKGASLSECFGDVSVGTPDRLFAERFCPRYDWAAIDNRFPQFRSHRDRLWSGSDAGLEEGETCLEALWKRPLFDHQWGAFERIVRTGRSTVVATGTGSGKTECFQIPLLYSLLTESGAQRRQRGIRALLVYPLNALVEDQIMRLRRLLFWVNLQSQDRCNPHRIERLVTFGRYTGDTPLDHTDRSRVVPREALDVLGEVVYREDMQANPPDVLITNFTMLEYMLLREDDRELFSHPEILRFVILDEIHTYSGTQGMEVSLLLRRLKTFLGVKARRELSIRFIGTSATLGGNEPQAEAARFATALFGDDLTPDDVIVGRPAVSARQSWNPEQWLSLFTLLADLEHGAPSVASFLKERTPIAEADWQRVAAAMGTDAPPTEDAHSERLGKLLSASGFADQFRSVLDRGLNSCLQLDSIAEALSACAVDPRALAGTLLGLIAAATLHCEPVISLRAHFFINEARDAQICIFPGCEPELGGTDSWWRRLYISHHSSCEKCDAPVYSVFLCRRCGFVYLEGWHWDHKLFPERDISEDQARYVRWLFRPRESDLPAAAREAGQERTLCLRCGKCLVAEDAPYFADAQANHSCPSDRLVPIIAWPPENLESGVLQTCFFCEQHWIPGEEVITGPAPSPYAVSTVLLEELNRHLGIAEPTKIISFSDTRQQAAKLALRLQSTNREFCFRQLLYSRLEEEVLSTDQVFESLYDCVRDDRKLRRLFSPEPGRLYDNAALREQLATLLYREAVTAYLTLEAQGLVQVHYAPELFERAATLQHRSRLLGRLEEADRKHWVLFLLDWGMRFRYAIGPHPWGGPVVAHETLQEWNIYLKKAGRHGANEPDVVGFAVRQRRPSNRLFNFASRLLRRFDGARAELDLDQFQAAVLPIWDGLLAIPELWASDRLPERPILNFGGETPDRCLLKLNFSALRWRAVQDSEPMFRCDACGRISFFSIGGVCPIRDCRGSLRQMRPVDIDAEAFSPIRHYRRLVRQVQMAPLWVEEHTAQISPSKRGEVEREFRSSDADSIDVVCGSTTFELGIDLGQINSVFMSNLPPRAANYRQRAGRAGRRPGAQPFVLNYVRQRPHDQYFWRSLDSFVAGPLPVPRLSITSREVVFRHLGAVFIARLLELYRQHRPGNIPLQGPPAGEFVDFCLRDTTEARIGRELEERSLLREMLLGLQRGLPFQVDPTRCWQQLTERLKGLRDTYLPLRAKDRSLDVLSDHGILPSYAFPIYVDALRLYQEPLEPPRSDLKLQRDRAMALREYGPLRTFVAGKHLILSEGLWQGYERKPFNFCPSCGQLDFTSGSSTLRCGHPALQRIAVTPKGGFFGRIVRSARGLADPETPEPLDVFFDPADDPPPECHRDGQALVLAMVDARKMTRARMRMFTPRPGQNGMLMAACSLSDVALPHVRPAQALQRVEKGQGQHLHLMHEFTTDILQLRFLDGAVGQSFLCSPDLQAELAGADACKVQWLYDSVWITLGTALALSGAVKLDIDAAEIAVITRRIKSVEILGGRDIILYDTSPGGAGYTRQLGDEIRDVMMKAQSRLECCDCQDSCYGCLRTYHNQLVHNRLNRKRVLTGLQTFIERNWA